MQNALNKLLEYTIFESEYHKSFAEELKGTVVEILNTARIYLSTDKEKWLFAIESMKKNLTFSQQKLIAEQSKQKYLNQEIEAIVKQKEKEMEKCGLEPNSILKFENYPPQVQRLIRQIEEKHQKKKEYNEMLKKIVTESEKSKKEYINSIS